MSKLPKSDLDCYWSAIAAQNLRARKPSAPYKISPLSRQQEWPAGSRAKWRNVVFPYVLWPFPSPRLGTRLRNKDSESDLEISCVGWDERAKGTMCVWVSSEYPSLHCREWGAFADDYKWRGGEGICAVANNSNATLQAAAKRTLICTKREQNTSWQVSLILDRQVDNSFLHVRNSLQIR